MTSQPDEHTSETPEADLENYVRTEMQRFLKRVLVEELDRFTHYAEAVSHQSRSDTSCSHGLSVRELEILQLLVNGLSNRQMANQLHLSEETVKTHMRHITEKLGVHSRTQAALIAVQIGLTRDETSRGLES